MKKEYQDDFENFIKKGLERQAELEMKAVEADEESAEFPDHLKESLHQKIQNRIREAENNERYKDLSEEDRKALELGRKMLEVGNVVEFKAPEKSGLSRRGKLHLKHAVGFVAVLAVVMTVQVTSLGGPEKIVEIIERQIVERDVEQINASSDSKVIVKENEEEAYQAIADEFGAEPVRLVIHPKEMKFANVEIDTDMQTASMTYKYNDRSIRYTINATHKDTAIGLDVEDEVVDSHYITNSKNVDIQIKEYKTQSEKTEYYLAEFSYNGLKYTLIGSIQKEEFEKIVKNLFFY